MVWCLVVSIPILCPKSYFVPVSVLLLFLTMPWVGLQRVVVVFPDHTRLCFISLEKLFNLHGHYKSKSITILSYVFSTK